MACRAQYKFLCIGGGGSRCTPSMDAPSNLGIHRYSEVADASHPRMPQVTWVSADTLTEVADVSHPQMLEVTWVSTDTLTEGMEVAGTPHPQMTWVSTDTLTEGMKVAGAPHPRMTQVSWVSADTLTEGMEVAGAPQSSTDAPSNLGIHGYSDRGGGGSRCAHLRMPQVT